MIRIAGFSLAACLLASVAYGQAFTGPAAIKQPTTANHCLKVLTTNGSTILDSGAVCGTGVVPAVVSGNVVTGSGTGIQDSGTLLTSLAPKASPTFTGTVTIPNGGIFNTPTSLTGTNITGTAAGFTAGNVTTNANLTGPITSVGNATSVAAQTGAGSTFVMQASPSLTTPNINIATGTSLALNGAGAASSSPFLMSGAILTGGTGTTNFPAMFIQPTGTTARTGLSTAGTGIGMNLASGFAGNFLDFLSGGGSGSTFKVGSDGSVISGSGAGLQIGNDVINANYSNGNVFGLQSAVVIAWANAAGASNAKDTSISRISAGITGFGTGAQGSVAGGIQAATGAFGGAAIGADAVGITGTMSVSGLATLSSGFTFGGGGGTLAPTSATFRFAIPAGNTTNPGLLMVSASTGFNASSGTQIGSSLAPTVTQTSTAAMDVFKINPTVTSKGSGGLNLIHCLAGASGTTEVCSLTDGGLFTTIGAVVSSTGIQSANSGYIGTASRGAMQFPSDGVWTLVNNAGTDWGRLQFGGTTSSFPAIKRNAAVLEAKLADDSAYTQVYGATLRTGQTTVAGLPAAVTAGAGAIGYVTDAVVCTFLTAVTGGGSVKCPVWSDGSAWNAG